MFVRVLNTTLTQREPVVVLINGLETECTTYVVVDKKLFIPPSSDYMGLLIEGATEHQLPRLYLEMLSRVPTQND
jgi:hypothetical protein